MPRYTKQSKYPHRDKDRPRSPSVDRALAAGLARAGATASDVVEAMAEISAPTRTRLPFRGSEDVVWVQRGVVWGKRCGMGMREATLPPGWTVVSRPDRDIRWRVILDAVGREMGTTFSDGYSAADLYVTM